VFETLLAADGEFVLLDEHLRRLEASVLELYGERLPPDLGLEPPAEGAWRIRVVFRPGAGVTVERAPATFPDGPLEPELLVLPGGLGAHKWVDRALVAGREPLIVDLTGEVLETGSGNLFVVEGDALITPPADGRILPGVVRAQVMRQAAVVEEAIDLQRMQDADDAFVTSSIRGIQPLRREVAAAALA
jgi:para-aminobenzoate synthetase/4-amino-4-deoxychorismate lyase